MIRAWRTACRRYDHRHSRVLYVSLSYVPENAPAPMDELLNHAPLRTPLNAVLGFGQLLQLSSLAPEDEESVEHILTAGRHLLGLINEVLDLSAVEAGQITLALEPVALGEVVRRSVDLVRPSAAERGIHILQDDDSGGERIVRADRKRLQQVLLNLLSNAIKYNRAGGQVSIRCEKVDAGQFRLLVEDSGYGIPPQQLDRLFAPFERLGADQGPVQGTGLGLALSRRLVEAMGGRIGVHSALGRGSTFWIDLP
jgi:signal transduction histidine kinase